MDLSPLILVRYRNSRPGSEGLEDEAVPFRQLDQLGQLFLRGLGIEFQGDPDAAETDRCFFRHSQRAPEIEVPLGAHREIIEARNAAVRFAVMGEPS